MRVIRRLAVAAAVALAACGPSTTLVQVPPRLDLQPYGSIGLVTFSTNVRPSLAQRATDRFAEEVLRNQMGIEVLAIEPSGEVLALYEARGFGPDFARAVGREHGVAAVFVGELEVKGTRPGVSIASVRDMQVGATVEGTLAVKLLSTRSGGTVWQSSGSATETVGQFNLAGGTPSVAVRNPDEAYDAALLRLVEATTVDLRPSWHRQ
ncbi:MAG: hypothetical protein MUC69_05595 [Gemmatimonadales bacterium]|jgi:hypothetical protein|nr:hypothetical protein [Gemmatimonadales bacterium]